MILSGVRVCEIPVESHGRWSTIGAVFTIDNNEFVVAECRCGSTRVVNYRSMTSGRSTSCGCYREEWASNRFTTHGDSGTPEYHAWRSMIDRCYNENCDGFHLYGGRGIRVCEEWLRSYESFRAHIGDRPTLDHSVDRFPDMDGDYRPGNVRWADKKQQANNRRSNRIIDIDGVSKTLSEWVDDIGIVDYSVVWSRLSNGWSPKDALITKSGDIGPRMLTHNGETKCVTEWSKQTGIPATVIFRRLDLGWGDSDALTTKVGGRMDLEIDGETKPIDEWSAISGVRLGTIYRRLSSGMSPKDAVWTKSRNGKNVG